MHAETMIAAPALAWSGALLLLAGELLALRHWRHLGHMLAWSMLAEFGLVLLGFGGADVGYLGGGMHVVYQLAMRALVLVTAARLARTAGGWSLDRLTGVGRTAPVDAMLFAFGMFSLMGLSPFRGALSRFLVLYDLGLRGEWMLAVVATVASVVTAVYAIRVIQAICFAAPRPGPAGTGPRARPWLTPSGMAAGCLALVTAAMNFYPEPVAHVAAVLFGGRHELPFVEGPWPTLATLPYVGAFALYVLGRVSRNARDVAAVVLAAATVVLACGGGAPDPVSHLFALLFAGVMLLVTVYSTAYMRHEDGDRQYFFFLFLMAGSLMGVVQAGDLGSFYLFWELMTWSSYLLIVHTRSAEALRGGEKYFVMCAGGAYVMLLGVIGAAVAAGSFELNALPEAFAKLGPVGATAVAICFLVGLGVKAGLVPLHGWLPQAHPAAPSPVSAPLSSILTKTGLYGLLKLLLAGFGAAFWAGQAGPLDFGATVSVVGVVTLLYGEVMAWRQDDLKRLLAYSTIAQVGEIVAVLGLGTSLAVAGATSHVLVHGAMKTLLFLAAGALVMRAGSRRLADLAGLGRRMPWTAACLTIGLLSIMGLPPFAGFTSKFLLVYASVRAGAVPVGAALLLGGAIGVLYYGRILRVVLFDAPSAAAARTTEAPLPMLLPLAVLALLLVGIGLAPAPLLDLAADAARWTTHAPTAVDLGWLLPDWPLAAIVCMAGGLATLASRRSGRVVSGVIAVGTVLAALAAVLHEAARYDALALPFAVVIAVIGALNLAYSIGYFAHHGHRVERFLGVTVLMIGGLLGMAGARDTYGLFFFWELMSSWTLYFAIVHEETPQALREGFKYFVFNVVGASCLFLGVTVLGAAAGSFEFAAIRAAAATMPAPLLGLGIGAAACGFAMKAAMLTVRVDWQMHPATAPTPVSGYISAVLLKAGPLGAFKLITLVGGATLLQRLGSVDGLDPISWLLVVVGAVTALYAGLMAFVQVGVKRLLIYSTVCQLGYVMCGLALGDSLSTAGALMHAVNHALLKDTLFLAAGAMLAQQHIVGLDELGGAGRRMPWTFAFFTLAGLSLAGVPPLAGLGSKWLLYQGALASGHPFVALALMAASVTTLAAVLKFVHAAFLGPESPAASRLHEAPATMLMPMGIMTGATLAIGLLPGLLLVPVAHVQRGLGLPAIEATWLGGLPGPYGWHPLTLVAPLTVVIALGWLLLRAGRPAVTVTHAHSCGVDVAPPDLRLAASHLYAAPAQLVRRALLVRGDSE
jgi:formate hydrogenlyase subunit 3/multisubunit Na+/H+ antiporter MnhD subunit